MICAKRTLKRLHKHTHIHTHTQNTDTYIYTTNQDRTLKTGCGKRNGEKVRKTSNSYEWVIQSLAALFRFLFPFSASPVLIFQTSRMHGFCDTIINIEMKTNRKWTEKWREKGQSEDGLFYGNGNFNSNNQATWNYIHKSRWCSEKENRVISSRV